MAYTAIDDPSAYFKVQLYTGNGAANHAITFDDTDTDMQPDVVWIKNRDATDAHCLFDAVRGATKVLIVDTNAAEATDADTLDSFASDGFQVDADVKVNTNAEKYVAWCWKESATAGFDMVGYEGAGVGTETNVSHSLSAVPELYIVKARESLGNFQMYHHKMSSAPETDYMQLDTTDAVADYTFWGDTAPTSSVFTVDDGDDVNAVEDYITYLWAPKQGFSKISKFVGNGNANGTFIYLGFRPAFVLLKQSAGTQGWLLVDSKRSPFNPTDEGLHPNANAAGDTGSDFYVDLLANGFKLRNNDAVNNGDNEPYIYIAFAEAPLVNSNGVPNNAR